MIPKPFFCLHLTPKEEARNQLIEKAEEEARKLTYILDSIFSNYDAAISLIMRVHRGCAGLISSKGLTPLGSVNVA